MHLRHTLRENCVLSSKQIPNNDTRFHDHEDECMPFSRSAPACGSGNTGHIFGASTVLQQMNTLTAFIDVGQVYGSDDGQARNLRDLSTDEGLLRVNTRFKDSGRELLPFATGNNICATRKNITKDQDAEDVQCFLAGEFQRP